MPRSARDAAGEPPRAPDHQGQANEVGEAQSDHGTAEQAETGQEVAVPRRTEGGRVHPVLRVHAGIGHVLRELEVVRLVGESDGLTEVDAIGEAAEQGEADGSSQGPAVPSGQAIGDGGPSRPVGICRHRRHGGRRRRRAHRTPVRCQRHSPRFSEPRRTRARATNAGDTRGPCGPDRPSAREGPPLRELLGAGPHLEREPLQVVDLDLFGAAPLVGSTCPVECLGGQCPTCGGQQRIGVGQRVHTGVPGPGERELEGIEPGLEVEQVSCVRGALHAVGVHPVEALGRTVDPADVGDDRHLQPLGQVGGVRERLGPRTHRPQHRCPHDDLGLADGVVAAGAPLREPVGAGPDRPAPGPRPGSTGGLRAEVHRPSADEAHIGPGGEQVSGSGRARRGPGGHRHRA